ncbi:PEPxxWA-CTERM sorting domain-containing protein [Sandarakinorhabdus sp. DWP1-3-1]|uniref:Npun_F0296 family exosortase-dependent surface protein n=1 Tax=Sandarakinorhabdus sp. DWP1-3-1 TaxID=2804627 RepID=UPI003CF5A2C5
MKIGTIVGAALLGLTGLSVPAAAVVVTSLPGAPDPGPASPFTMVATFDTPTAAGIVQSNIGTVIAAAGSISGVRAAPAGTLPTDVYLSLGANSSATFDFAGYVPANKKLGGISFYWGSIDSYNFVDFLAADNSVIGSFGGSQLPQFNGNQTLGATNRRVDFAFNALEQVSKVRFRSTTSAAFELDSIAASIAPIPEPSSWAMLVAGFGLVGLAARRRGRAVAA